MSWKVIALLAGVGASACSSQNSGGDFPKQPGDEDTSKSPATGAGAGAGGSTDTDLPPPRRTDDDDLTAGGDDDLGGIYTTDAGTVCEEFAVRAAPTIPDILIVLDRSGSMKRTDDLPGDKTNRWDPSVGAVKSITAQLEQDVHFGLMLFPSDPPDLQACVAQPDPARLSCLGCVPGKVSVKPGANTSATIAKTLDATQPYGGTPTAASLDEARKYYDAVGIDPDAPPAPQTVLLVTDGQPTCPNGSGNSDATAEQLAKDRDQAIKSIDALRTSGVKTYVVSYDNTLDAAFTATLTEFAKHGGTGNYYAVQDDNQADIVSTLKKIAEKVVSCSYELDTEPQDPSYVQVKLDDKQLNLNAADGWIIKGRAVTVQGAACESLQDGAKHLLDVKVLCDIVTPI